MGKKTCPPSIRETAFECPHCGAFTTQYWFRTLACELADEYPLPPICTEQMVKKLQSDTNMPEDTKKEMIPRVSEQAKGHVYLWDGDGEWGRRAVNLHISKCYNCKKMAVWVHESMVFPHDREGPQPNQDLPEDVVKDFEEARSIVGLSPRGSAALLRLCIQKLCMFLGETGKDLNQDIAALVKRGLNPLVQRSLDIVRVIGNEAVHPGVIDLNDNRDIAERLFELVNSIADQMISHPKCVNYLYEKLPSAKRKEIEKRDGGR